MHTGRLEKLNNTFSILCPQVEFDNFQGSSYSKMAFFLNIPKSLMEDRDAFETL